MSDLISRKIVIKKLESLEKHMENEIEDAEKHPENYTRNFIRCMEEQVIGVAHAAHEIIDMPSATEKTGKWIDKGDYVVCSRCAGTSWQQMNGVENIPFKSKYCPNCGARMVGDNDEK